MVQLVSGSGGRIHSIGDIGTGGGVRTDCQPSGNRAGPGGFRLAGGYRRSGGGLEGGGRRFAGCTSVVGKKCIPSSKGSDTGGAIIDDIEPD